MKKTKRAPELDEIVAFMDEYLAAADFNDYDGAKNGLQCANSGKVGLIATAVDAGLGEIKLAAHMGANLLIVHHGMFWNPPIPFVGANHDKIKTLVDSDMAVYSSHLPLDAHPKIGNNALLAKALGLKVISKCFDFHGSEIGVAAAAPKGGRDELERMLSALFPDTFKAIRFGSREPKVVGICSGGSGDCIAQLSQIGADTLVCGELSQYHFTTAQEQNLNLYPCGHYATERFGVMALGELVAEKFGLKCNFIEMRNPL